MIIKVKFETQFQFNGETKQACVTWLGKWKENRI